MKKHVPYCRFLSRSTRLVATSLMLSILYFSEAGPAYGHSPSPLRETDYQSPKRQVSGKVSDETGSPLPGVSVIIKGTTRGTTTNGEGQFQLDVPDNTTTLVFSFVGYTTKEVVVGTQSTINLSLAPEDKVLNEVVVVGYGTQQKVNLTGAVGVADGERLQNRPIANAGEGLQGVIPNLNVGVRNGDPAQPVTFNIRGYESINGGAPLVLVDNVPMDLNRINPI